MADDSFNADLAQRFSRITIAFLENVKRAGFPPIHTLPVGQARQSYRASVGAMELPRLPLPRVQDFAIPGPAGAIPARLWAASEAANLPVFLYLHGGGFVIGDIETCDSMCRQVAAQSGAAVVAVNYRLAPEHKFADCLADAWTALQWLANRSGPLGLDGSRLAVGGDSAGGGLSATVSLMARDAGIPVALQALIYPTVQTRAVTESFKLYAQGTLLTGELMKWFEDQARGPLDHDWHREPLHAPSHAGVAPAWIGLAECDALADDGRRYADVLRAAGVPVVLREWPGVIHDFINMGRFMPEAAELHSELAHAVKMALMR